MTRFFAAIFSALFLLTPSVFAHGDEEHAVEINGAWARDTFGRTMSAAAYMTITNKSHNIIILTGVSSDAAAINQIHQSKEEDGVMRMKHIETLPIAPGETLSLAPGGYHVMLMRLNAALKKGESFPITLHFERIEDQKVTVEITGVSGPESN